MFQSCIAALICRHLSERIGFDLIPGLEVIVIPELRDVVWVSYVFCLLQLVAWGSAGVLHSAWIHHLLEREWFMVL